ncbi:lysozyme inhibitor LprI family protein [Undibacterium sp. TJN19]|uniref:lysozyme inhibitor LprI family protein n=1 Tax=Undibacterium sp. TJN19 TaxID=3413055 RepID=UPI003BF1BC7F
MRQLLSLLTLACTCSFAHAIDCSKAQNTMDLNECASIDLQKVEAKLNQVYQRVLKSTEKDYASEGNYADIKKSFINAQRAWIKFREADCDAVYQRNIGGTIRTVMHLGCMRAHALKRIADLEEYEKN